MRTEVWWSGEGEYGIGRRLGSWSNNKIIGNFIHAYIYSLFSPFIHVSLIIQLLPQISTSWQQNTWMRNGKSSEKKFVLNKFPSRLAHKIWKTIKFSCWCVCDVIKLWINWIIWLFLVQTYLHIYYIRIYVAYTIHFILLFYIFRYKYIHTYLRL